MAALKNVPVLRTCTLFNKSDTLKSITVRNLGSFRDKIADRLVLMQTLRKRNSPCKCKLKSRGCGAGKKGNGANHSDIKLLDDMREIYFVDRRGLTTAESINLTCDESAFDCEFVLRAIRQFTRRSF